MPPFPHPQHWCSLRHLKSPNHHGGARWHSIDNHTSLFSNADLSPYSKWFLSVSMIIFFFKNCLYFHKPKATKSVMAVCLIHHQLLLLFSANHNVGVLNLKIAVH